jgi:hypothetical protein
LSALPLDLSLLFPFFESAGGGGVCVTLQGVGSEEFEELGMLELELDSEEFEEIETLELEPELESTPLEELVFLDDEAEVVEVLGKSILEPLSVQ